MIKQFISVIVIIKLSGLLVSCGADNKADTNQPVQRSENTQQTTATPQNYEGSSTSSGLAAYDVTGQLRNLDEWVGKQPVVVNVWGTWCPPCRMEIPDLVRLYDEYNSKGVEILSLAVRDTPQRVVDYSNRAGMKWIMLMGNMEVIEHFGVTSAVPTTIFLDKDGKEVARFVGMRDYNAFKPAFEAISQG